jgi:hypothetical protein
MKVRLLIYVLLATVLSACGSSGAALPAPSNQPAATAQTVTVRVPAPAAVPSTSLIVTGRVVRLVGPLSAAATHPPTSTGAPIAGSGISNVIVYAVPATAILASGIPVKTAIAHTRTSSTGGFSITLPSTVGPQIGLVAVAGPLVARTGTTRNGYTVAHAVVNVGTRATLYLDTLTTDEQSAFGVLNVDRGKAKMNLVYADTSAEMAIRLMTALTNASKECKLPGGLLALYDRLGVVPSTIVGAMPEVPIQTVPPTWSEELSLSLQPGVVFAGFHAIYNGNRCPQPHHGARKWSYDFFGELLIVNAPA